MGQVRSRENPKLLQAADTGFSAADFRVPKIYLELLLGHDIARKLLAHEHPPRDAADPQLIPSLLFLKLCLKRMRETMDESYGTASKPVPKGTLGILMAAASHGRDFADALSRFAAAAQILRSDINVGFVKGHRNLNLHLGYSGARSARMELLLETYAISLLCAFRWLTGAHLQLQRVRIATPVGEFRKSIIRGVVACPISQRGSGVTLGYDIANAAQPLAAVKYETWAAHEFSEFMALLEEAATARRTRLNPTLPAVVNAVRNAISSGDAREEAVAERLRMSSASLRRRLAEAGLSFRTLLHDERRDLASALLMTDKPLEEIASEMHYSDVRSFRRACFRWFGMPPGAYRASKPG